jgi:hypothetical protein
MESENIQTNAMEPQGRILSWEEANITSTNYVRFETDVEKKLIVEQWRLEQKEDKFTGTQRVFFIAKVANEDGIEVDKVLENSSTRLRMALYKHLKDKNPNERAAISITRTGEKTNTQYLVKLVGE